MVNTGTARQYNAISRHGIIVLRIKITSIPIVSQTVEYEFKIPRVFGSLERHEIHPINKLFYFYFLFSLVFFNLNRKLEEKIEV